jgi:hypothetical protein
VQNNDTNNAVFDADMLTILDEDTSPAKIRKLFYKYEASFLNGKYMPVTESHKCPVDVLEYIAKNGDRETKYSVLAGAKMPPLHVIEILAESDSAESRSQIFESLSDAWGLSPKLVKDLQQSRFEILRRSVAGNPYLSSMKVFEKASVDQSPSVRLACANNPNCPSRVLSKLILDDDPEIRAAVVANDNFSKSAVGKHWKETNRKVQLSYLSRDDCPTKAVDYYFNGGECDGLEEIISSHTNASKYVLESLAKNQSKSVRTNVALNKNSPKSAIQILACDSESAVRSAAGFHRNCPSGLFSSAFKIPDVIYPEIDQLDNLGSDIQNIKNIYKECLSVANEAFPMDDLIPGHENISNISVAWRFKYFLAPPAYVDRTRGMLAGPFYTSIKYPWPKSSDGKLLEPIIQIDLDELSKLRGSSYGTGLLQVFSSGVELIVRIIPRDSINAAEIVDYEWRDFGGDSHPFYEWMVPTGVLDRQAVYQIVGYKTPYVSSDVDCYEDDESDLPFNLKSLNALLRGVSGTCNGNHVFGTYREIQGTKCDGELLVALGKH